jgi:Uncharacterized alpha/beta hydrolase domain (DUF2235)
MAETTETAQLASVSQVTAPKIRPVPKITAASDVVADQAPTKRAKKIILLSDGTGNSERSPFKTNVWRTYQALKLADGKQVACYDNGVGTSTLRPLALLGGAFGWGLKRNVLSLYKFLCRKYTPGDEIYGFGFSRGAFTIRVLVSLVETQGLIRYKEGSSPPITEAALTRYAAAAYRDYRKERYHALLARVGRFIRDVLLRIRDTVWETLGIKPYKSSLNVQVEQIRFLGLWDTVDAYGLPIRELKSAVDLYVWPLTFQNLELGEKVKTARHALASTMSARPSTRSSGTNAAKWPIIRWIVFARSGLPERTPMSGTVIPMIASPMCRCCGYLKKRRRLGWNSNGRSQISMKLAPIHSEKFMIRAQAVGPFIATLLVESTS